MSLRPKEVCQRLGVSSATLRRWSDTFAAFLSPAAGRSVSESGGAAQRRYTETDAVLLATVKQLLDAGNTYEETARKLPELIVRTPVVEYDTMPVPIDKPPTEPIVGGSVHALEAYREAIASKDETIQALQQTIYYQNILLTELRATHQPLPIGPGFVPMTFRQRLDWLLRGRMIGRQRERHFADSRESAQRLLPHQESA